MEMTKVTPQSSSASVALHAESVDGSNLPRQICSACGYMVKEVFS